MADSEKTPLIERGLTKTGGADQRLEDEEKSHNEVLELLGGYSWFGFAATMILIPAKVSGDLIVNIVAFY